MSHLSLTPWRDAALTLAAVLAAGAATAQPYQRQHNDRGYPNAETGMTERGHRHDRAERERERRLERDRDRERDRAERERRARANPWRDDDRYRHDRNRRLESERPGRDGEGRLRMWEIGRASCRERV